jgi:hypothetical protein
MKNLVVILVGIGLLLLSGCAGSTPPAPTSVALPSVEPATPPLAPTALPTSEPATPVPTPTAPPTPEPATPAPAPTALSTPAPAAVTLTSAEELLGVWHLAHAGGSMGDSFTRYSADGTMRTAGSLDELDTEPRTESEYWFENGVFFIRDTAGLPGWDVCVQGNYVGQYRLEVLANGNVRTVLIEDGCEMRAMFKNGKETVRVP